MSRRDDQRLEDILAAVEAIGDHLRRSPGSPLPRHELIATGDVFDAAAEVGVPAVSRE